MDILRQSLAVALVFALLLLAVWLLRKRSGLGVGFLAGHPGKGPLESVAKLALGPQHALYVVRAGERQLILAVHPRGIAVVGEVDGAPARLSPEFE